MLPGAMDDLEEAIHALRQAIQGAPDGDPHLVLRLNNLGNELEDRYGRTEKIEDLEEAVSVPDKALQISPDGHTYLATLLNNLGNKLERRYERKGNIEDLEEAIQVSRKSILATSDDHSDLAMRLHNLGNKLGRRYGRTKKMDDLEEAIQVSRQAIEATSDSNSDFAALLDSLASKLQSKYEQTGNTTDLEEAIQVSRQAVQITPDDHADIAAWLNNLGNKLESHYNRTGKMTDLEEAILVSRQSIEATPESHPSRAGRWNNLGTKLGRRYLRTGQMDNLDEAIRVTRQAVQATPNDHPDLVMWLNNLGNHLGNRHLIKCEIGDLKEAIQVSRQAVQDTPNDHPDLAIWLHNLGNKLEIGYVRTGQRENLEEAIQVSRRAVQVTPIDHPDLAARLNNLGNKLERRYKHERQTDDIEEAIRVSRQAVTIASAPPLDRIKAATFAINLLVKRKDYDSAHTLVVEAIDLLRLVHNRYLTLQDQQYVVSHFSGLATQACSLALQTGQCLFKALQSLETGRGVILSLLMDDRSDTSELRKAHPALCALYECLRLEVNTPTESAMSPRIGEPSSPRRPEALKELEKCIQDIRQLPGFGSFQQGLTVEQMKSASNEGSIIVVNMTSLRSDAIIISSEELKLVPLPRFSAVQAQIWVDQGSTGMGNKPYRLFLSWLWRGCVNPILNELGYHVRSSPEGLPRVWWIGTGLASAFPFHAACDISVGPTESTFCRVISSYTPTIKALLHARERGPLSTLSSERPPKLMIVTMTSTPDANDLPGVESERSAVEELLGAATRIEVLEHPDSVSVISGIRECQIAHFACHGISNAFDPSQSGLLLQTPAPNPRQDILSVLKLCENRPTQGEIAYLSACSTAENRAQHLVDEVLHIVSGFQIAGFRHVIGTLWPSDDKVCVEIAKLFYAELCRNGTLLYTDRSIAVALHKAAVLVSTSEDYRKRPLHWAQYVHYGA